MELHVTVAGSGPRVVCTHGLGATSATWHAQVPALARTHEVVTWDLRGHGRSRVPAGARCDRAAAAADLAHVAGHEPAVYVGHSLGGYLSLVHAIRYPERVAGLALIATGPGFRDSERRERWNAGLSRVARDLGVPPAVATMAAQPDAVVIDRLGEIDVPAIVVVGSADRRYHVGSAYLARRLHADLLVVDGAGHHPHETHPEPVNRAVAELCARASAAVGRTPGT